jgi:hypothetical protein
MNVLSEAADKFTIELSADEVMILGNSMNEALEALDDPELSIRMGVGRAELKRLLSQFVRINNRLENI